MAKPDPDTGLNPPRHSRSFDLETPQLQIHLLGGFRVIDGAFVIEGRQWRLAKARSLVAMLALSPDRRRHREEIVDCLWPDVDPSTGSSNLRYALHIARRTLDSLATATGELIVRQGDFVALSNAVPIQVDVEQFELSATRARDVESADLVRAAIDLYTGDLLPEDRYEDWVITRREALRGRYLELLTQAAVLAENSGDLDDAIAWTERILTEDRSNEESHYRLMRLYALGGRRGDALRQYRALETELRRSLDVAPDAATQQLRTDILSYKFPPLDHSLTDNHADRGPTPGQHTFPHYLTSFVGRQHDIAGVTDLLRSHRLVTLTGIGGVGKTRLASVLAGELADEYSAGVTLIDLSSVNTSRLIWSTIALAYDLGEVDDDRGMERIANQDGLLLLDNCEHLVDGAATFVASLLGAGPMVRVLATSRQVLHLAGEAVWHVAPLELPREACLPSLNDVRESDAVSLFIDRLRLRQPHAVLTDDIAPHVVDICRMVDGLPLALEMAAARAASLSLPDLSSHLRNSPALLKSSDRESPKRHSTLHAMLDWSYELLDRSHQSVFERLSVFAGSWTLDAAEAVAVSGDIREIDVLDTLAELVDTSLVLREGDVLDARYRFLAPVRQYASEQLRQSGAERVVRRRHANLYLTLAEAAEPNLRGPQQSGWMERLGRNVDDLRLSLSWLLDNDPPLALRLAVALGRFWYLGGHLREGRDALRAALRASSDGDILTRARALYHAGILSDEAGDHLAAMSSLKRALALLRQCGEPADVAAALNSLGVVARAGDDLDAAQAFLEESLTIRRELGDPKLVSSTLGNLAITEWSRGDLAKARDWLTESVALAKDAGDEWSMAIGNAHLGRIAWERAEHREAGLLFGESLRLARQVGDRGAVVEGLEGLAGVKAALGDATGAACLWGAAEAQRETLDLPIPAPELPLYERMLAAGREHVDDSAFTNAWDAGRRSPLNELVEKALVSVNAGHVHSGSSGDWEMLTPRQREIATLVAREMTNQQIAEQLGIARRTVDTHVGSILQTLGVSSRLDVARRVPD